MAVWWRGVTWQERLPWNLEEGSSWAFLGNHGIESWCLLLVLCFWYFVIVALDFQFWLCICCTCNMMYMWRCLHIVEVVPCTCDIMYTLCRWCSVQVVLCTYCTYGTGVHVVLCACHTCCVAGMRYYVYTLCSCGILTCVFIVLYYVYVFVLCCTSSVCVWIVCQV